MIDKLKAPVVLITRPATQQSAFSDGCRDLGFSVSLLPCLQILPCKTDKGYLDRLLEDHTTVLFTSANAVHSAHGIRAFPWPKLHIHAIGAASAKALEQYQQVVALTPQSPFNSEAYIEQLGNAPPESLLIIKGCGGRGVIEPALVDLGWHVSVLDVYERVRPDLLSDDINAIFASSAPDIISVTSDEVLNNLWHLCHQHTNTLRTRPLVVNSERCASLAIDLGFKINAWVAVPAGDKGQLLCLERWKKTVFDKGAIHSSANG